MKHRILLLLLLILAAVQTGCQKGQNTGTKYTLKAIVISGTEGSLMVAADGKASGLSPFEPASVSYNKKDIGVLERGTVIQITYDGTVRESYPVQLTAKKITVLEAVKDNWPPTLRLNKDYSPEAAKEDGCYVESLSGRENRENAFRFQQNSSQGICSYLRRVAYTTEGDPLITDFIYDGTKFYAVFDSTRDAYAGSADKISTREYSYIHTYEKGSKKIIYLANEKDLSPADYEKLVINAKGEILLDTCTIYSDQEAE